jgi:hypothetical protein
MIERLYIKDVAKELDLKDNRSAYRWCKNNGVGILSDIGCKRKYIIKAEFISAKVKQMLKYVTTKYKDVDATEIFHADIQYYIQLQTIKEQQDTHHFHNPKNKIEYSPRGDSEKNFLNSLSLQNILK